MSGFAVMRHPHAGLCTVPAAAIPMWRGRGWERVSEFRQWPSDFHLPDFADATAVDEEPEPMPAPDVPAEASEDEEK